MWAKLGPKIHRGGGFCCNHCYFSPLGWSKHSLQMNARVWRKENQTGLANIAVCFAFRPGEMNQCRILAALTPIAFSSN